MEEFDQLFNRSVIKFLKIFLEKRHELEPKNNVH